MYTEDDNKKSLKPVFIKIVLLVLFIFLLMILFPTKGFVTNYIDKKVSGSDGNFNSNLIAMASAGSGYYTSSRLPQNTGDTSKMTLKEMLDKKIIVTLTDNKGITCSTRKSYIEVKKEEDEYTMKVNLSCADKMDYIILHMGLDGKQFPSTSTARCTFVKNSLDAWAYGEWSSWGTDRIEESDTVQVETSTKQIQTGSKVVTKDEFERKEGMKFTYNDGRVYYVCISKYDNAGTYNYPVICEKKTTVYYSEPVYGTVTYYRSRSKSLDKGKTESKEASCDDDSLIKEGYTKLD